MKRFILIALLLIGSASACTTVPGYRHAVEHCPSCACWGYDENGVSYTSYVEGHARTSVPDPCAQGKFCRSEIADVKTCGCPKSASCGDCCGREHCRCNPN